METTVTRSLADIERAIADGLDPAAAIRELDRLEASLDQSFDDMLADADRFAAELEREIDHAFGELDQRRYGELDFEVHADIAEALAALKALEAAAGEAGERAADRFWQDARGRWHDGSGRFVSEAVAMFGDVADGAQKAGDATGKAFEGGMSVLGKAGPANVAIAAAAIQALPLIAGVAAGGIVAAIGGGLAAVGFKAAASSDQVRHAWSETADEIKKELADVAKPFEGSAIRAAEVAEKAFDRLKPSLKRIFADLVPDVDHFIRMVGQGIGSLGPTLARLGDAAGNVLRELGDRMPAIIDNISDTLDALTQIANEDPQMLANLVEDATELLRIGAEVLRWADEIKAFATLPIDASNAGNKLFEAMFGATPEQMQQDMDKLPLMLARIQADAAAGALAIQGVGGAGDDAASGVRNLTAALEELFDPAAAALNAEIRLKDALKEAAAAAKDKKTTEIDRLKSVQDITRAVADAAKAESERTGKTNESSAAFARQLPTLIDLAGKNDAARDAVAGLGNSLGVTIGRTDEGKIAIDKFGKAVVTLPDGKRVKIDADTAKALTDLQTTKNKVDDVKDKKVKVDADTGQAVKEVGKVKTGLDGLKGQAQKAGRDLGAGLTAGIRSMIGDAIAAAKSLAQSALDGAKNLLGIRSPSTAMAEVGRWTVKGLIQGLESEQGSVKTTIERMVDQIKEAFKSQPDVAEGLLDFVRKGNKNLEDLALQREALVQKLADAKEMAKRVAGSAQEWADITGMKAEDITGAGDMAAELQSKASAINSFANNIQTLAKRGLNKKIIQDIIDAGVERGASFAEMLVGSDGAEIKALNKAQAAVDKASKKLGKASADAMYDVGKKSGEGYLKGLQDSLAKLDAEMTKIVKSLVAAIKRELKIKSPSQVMADIGVNTMAGWIVGVQSMADAATAAMQDVISSTVKGSIPLDPTMGSLKPLTGGLRDVGDVSQHGFTPPAAPAAATPTGGVTVTMHGTTIREEADVRRVGAEFGFEYTARAGA
ncbi:hypothetical protein ACFSKW_54650 [Nonomuraea mangrovi]|uniref:Uncharacterized protein n=1 Tax=Nonomuraea mangrovi TaxID=2316207 RepID=A0ABW4TJB0_9ACTN